MRMKWRLFSVSLRVSMAMPPMPEFSSSEVSVELNVSAARKKKVGVRGITISSLRTLLARLSKQTPLLSVTLIHAGFAEMTLE